MTDGKLDFDRDEWLRYKARAMQNINVDPADIPAPPLVTGIRVSEKRNYGNAGEQYQRDADLDRPLLTRGSAHYRTLDPEPITVMQAWKTLAEASNALKYIARVHSGINGLDKNVEDLGKAIHYLELWRDRLQRESSASSQPSD